MPRPKKATEAALLGALLNAAAKKKRAPARKYGGKGAYRPRAVRGRGFYSGFGKDLGSWLGKAAGTLIGQGDLGSKIGGHLGQMGANYTGFGAYSVKHNSLVPEVPGISNPKKEGATQVRHKEYLGDVLSSTGFQTQYELPINAANLQTFPWLSQIAQNFTQYEVNGMLFEFVSTSGDTTAGTASLGDIIMATNYDSVQPDFTNKQQMLNQQFSVSAKPSVNVIHPIECANNQTTIPLLYTLSGEQPPNTDIRLYNLGKFVLATQGQQAAGNTLGELWVTYDILLYKPLLGGPGGVSPGASSVARYDMTNSSNANTVFGSISNAKKFDTIGLTVADSNVLEFPLNSYGTYKIDLMWYYPTSNAGYSCLDQADGLSIPTGWSTINTFPTSSGFETTDQVVTRRSSGSNAIDAGDAWYSVVVQCEDSSKQGVFTWASGSATSASWNRGVLMVTQLPDAYA